jgi:uncharacterized protein YbjT (DUF2867 family)
MDIAIIGGGGRVGSATARKLIADNHRVRCICRNPGSVPPDLQPCFVAGDLAVPASLAKGLAGADGLFLITPSVEGETKLGLEALAAARAAAVGKIVYMATMHPEQMQAVPHFRNKLPIKRAAMNGWRNHVILQPNYFFQNDLFAIQAMLHGGIFPLPLGHQGVDAIDTDDIAAAAAIALTSSRLDGTVVPLSGHDRLTGPTIAQTYAHLLARPVAYCGDDLTHFGALLKQIMPSASDWEIDDMVTMFGEFQRIGGHANAADVLALEAILGRSLRRYADFATALAASQLSLLE